MEVEYDFSQGKRGAIESTPTGKTRITIPTGKTRIKIRLDDEVLAWFRDQVHAAGAGNYQTLILYLCMCGSGQTHLNYS